MNDTNQTRTPRKYVQGQPFMPLWLDEMPLNDSQMRVLLHLWRRGPNCYPTVEQIATYLKKNESTVARIIKKLEGKGLLKRSKRKGRGIHNRNSYKLLVPNSETDGKKIKDNDPNASFKHGIGGGTKDLQMKDLKNNEQTTPKIAHDQIDRDLADFKPMPCGMANSDSETYSLPDEITTLEWAFSYYRKFKHDAEKNIGILKEREIEDIAIKWRKNLIAQDGKIDGKMLRKPRLALQSFLEAAANNQSKRCNEFRGVKTRRKKVNSDKLKIEPMTGPLTL